MSVKYYYVDFFYYEKYEVLKIVKFLLSFSMNKFWFLGEELVVKYERCVRN